MLVVGLKVLKLYREFAGSSCSVLVSVANKRIEGLRVLSQNGEESR